jgi:hypothetical protein
MPRFSSQAMTPGDLPASLLSHRFAQLHKGIVCRIHSNQSVPRIIEVKHHRDCQRDDCGKQHHVQPAVSCPLRRRILPEFRSLT